MKNMDNTTELCQETERKLREAVSQLATKEERNEALQQTARFLQYMEQTQRTAMVPRLGAFAMQQTVYYYLLRNRQLGRRVGDFDADVKSWIQELLSTLLYENECGED